LRFACLALTCLVLDAFLCGVVFASENPLVDFDAIESPIILAGDAGTAYRDPTAVYHQGVFYLYYTHIIHEQDKTYWCTGLSKSRDLVHWTEPERITPKDRSRNFCAPGNIIRYKGRWVMCLQTYPTPQGQKYGNEDARVWIMKSDDLEKWGNPEMLMVKGANVPREKMGRLIDPYLVEDKEQPGKWWCFFDDDAANISYSFDLKNWTYCNRIDAGENVCVLPDGDKYLMFHSPKNGIGVKRSRDMRTWRDVWKVTTKHGTGPITLGQINWSWAQGRLSAAFVMDLRRDAGVGKYLMFFHGSGPEPEPVHFDTNCSLGIAWSDDLIHWDWPGKDSDFGKTVAVDAPFEMPLLHTPSFPDLTFDVRDYGAVADGKTKNTAAFKAAIDDCAKAGGGTVLVGAGTWLTGAIRLQSNVNLHIQKEAQVRFSADFGDYLPAVFTRYEGTECYNYSPLIYANGCTDIAITGSGTLDGNGKAWWQWRELHRDGPVKLYEMTKGMPVMDRVFADQIPGLRPSFIQPINCRNVFIEGVTVRSGPMWTIHPAYCENVIVRNVTLSTRGPNNDGINPDSCRNVLIEHCNFDTSDDAIAIKSGKNEDGWRVGRPCENVVIRHCRFGLGAPCDGVVSVGSEMSGGVRNVYIHDCFFDQTVRGFRIKSKRGRGGFVENVYLHNITTARIGGEPVLLNTFYGSDSLQAFTARPPVFRNIHISSIRCQYAENAARIVGLPEQPIQNLTFEDFSVAAENGLACSDVEGLTLNGLNITAEKKPLISLKNCRDVVINRAACPEGTDVFLRLEGENSKNIRIRETDLSRAKEDIVFGPGVAPETVDAIDFSAMKSPVILRGDEDRAFRDPAAVYHDGLFRLFYTYWLKAPDGVRYSYLATSRSRDLLHWTRPRILSPQDLYLNFSSPGNIIRYKGEWIICLQTYPTPEGQKYGNKDCRLWTMKSKDLERWGPPEMLMVKGPNVSAKDIGRIIDPYLIQDKEEPEKWWCFFDDNAANLSYSYDLRNWTYFKRIPAGENPCVIARNNEYFLFHSPGNGIGLKKSTDLVNWQDVGGPTPKGGTGPITLGQENWPWAKQRLTAGFVLDLAANPNVGRYLMFFHAEPPGGFKKYASIGLAWSRDLLDWNWPNKQAGSQ